MLPVADAAHEIPNMDKVKRVLVEGPRLFDVVDLEAYVRRDPRWLDWTEVGSDDFGRLVSSVIFVSLGERRG